MNFIYLSKIILHLELQHHTLPFEIINQTHLILSHIKSSDVSILTHQPTENIAVTPAAATEIQYPAALHGLRHYQTTAIVPERTERVTLFTSRGIPKTAYKPECLQQQLIMSVRAFVH